LARRRLGPPPPLTERPLTTAEARILGAPASWRIRNTGAGYTLSKQQNGAWFHVDLPDGVDVGALLDPWWNPPAEVTVDVPTLTRMLLAVRNALAVTSLPPQVRAELLWVKRQIGG